MYVIACAEQNLFRTCRHVYSKVPTLSATLVCVYVMMTLCAIVASNGGCDGCDSGELDGCDGLHFARSM